MQSPEAAGHASSAHTYWMHHRENIPSGIKCTVIPDAVPESQFNVEGTKLSLKICNTGSL